MFSSLFFRGPGLQRLPFIWLRGRRHPPTHDTAPAAPEAPGSQECVGTGGAARPAQGPRGAVRPGIRSSRRPPPETLTCLRVAAMIILVFFLHSLQVSSRSSIF